MYYIIICIFNYCVFKHFTSCFLFLFLFILRKGQIGLRGSQQHISTYWHNYPLTVPHRWGRPCYPQVLNAREQFSDRGRAPNQGLEQRWERFAESEFSVSFSSSLLTQANAVEVSSDRVPPISNKFFIFFYLCRSNIWGETVTRMHRTPNFYFHFKHTGLAQNSFWEWGFEQLVKMKIPLCIVNWTTSSI